MKIINIFSAMALLLTGASTAKAGSVLTMRDTITDPHIVYPESYEADTHKMLQNWYLQTYIDLDRDIDLRGDVAASDDELISRLKKMPTIIEMPFNSIVRSYIEMYTQRRRQLVENMLGLSTYYMPIFEQALEVEHVPLELKYLPIIESALNPDAVSRAGATGLWQFMLPTARGLGMEISSLVDERRDPIVSSQMAARYLKQLHDIYNDWSLAIAAYNCGPGNVNKALRQAGEGRKDFWEIYPYLPQETRGYVPSFIAANYVMNYYDKHNISPALAKRPIITDSVHVCRRIHFQQISDILDIPVEAIRTLNPQYREDIIPGDIHPYALVLPSKQALCYVLSEDSIANHNAHLYSKRDVVEPSTGATRLSDDGETLIVEEIKYHKVKKGDTFKSIAARYGVTQASIKKINGIKTLRRGRTIKIVTTKRVPKPVEETAPADTTATQTDVAPDTIDLRNLTDAELVVEEVVEAGDTESAEVESESQNSDTRIVVREETKQPEQPKPVEKKKEPAPTYHKVKKGDNLYKISKQYGTTVDKIKSLNPSIKGNQVNIGQRIRVK